MRHEAGHVALRVADSGDVFQRAVGIGRVRSLTGGINVAPEHLAVGVELRERGRVREVAALAVGDGHAEQFARRSFLGEGRLMILRFQENILAAELERTVPHQRAGQQPCLGQNLKPVADAQHRPALRGEILHRLHDGAEARDGSGAQVVAVAEAARHDHGVGVAQRGVLVPGEARGMAEHVL